MPSYKILRSSTPSMVIVDITHDDGTVRTNVGFKLTYSDEADLKRQLALLVRANQDMHYAIKAQTRASHAAKALVGQTIRV